MHFICGKINVNLKNHTLFINVNKVFQYIFRDIGCLVTVDKTSYGLIFNRYRQMILLYRCNEHHSFLQVYGRLEKQLNFLISITGQWNI